MSDFDKFFADKLDEEGQSPRREKNWRTLSRRLDAFDTGLHQKVGNTHRYLRYWQAVAACAIITAGWLTWKVTDVQNEKQELQRGLISLEEKNRANEQEIALLNASAGIKNLAATGLPGSLDNNNKLNPEVPPAIELNKHRKLPSTDHPGNQHNAEAASDLNTAQSIAAYDTNSVSPTSPGQTPALNNLTIHSDSLVTAVAEAGISPDSMLLPIDTTLRAIAEVRSDSSRQTPSLSKQDTVALAASPKIIEPAPNPSRFKAGIQVLAGVSLPKEKGVSMLLGQGITAEYNLWRSFWLTASVDWLHFDISTEKYIPKFHSHHHKPPQPGGSPQEKLVKVESTQRQQHFGLGLHYSLPVRTWIRPAVRLTYSMIRTSPETITFKFEQKPWPGGPPGGPPKPKYTVRKTESQLIENVWRLGAGLEHDTPIWTFGLWADYSKNFAASDLTFDALTLRAGIQYKFN